MFSQSGAAHPQWYDGFVVLLLTLAAWGWLAAISPPPPSAVAGRVVTEAEAKDLDGQPVRLDKWKGRVLLVNVWAPWCGPCRVEVPDLVRLQARYSDDLVVLGLTVDAPIPDIRAFMDEYGINYPILLATSTTMSAFPPVQSLPSSFLVGHDGLIKREYIGVPDMSVLNADVKRALALRQL